MCVFSVEGGTVRIIGEHNEKDQVYRVTEKVLVIVFTCED